MTEPTGRPRTPFTWKQTYWLWALGAAVLIAVLALPLILASRDEKKSETQALTNPQSTQTTSTSTSPVVTSPGGTTSTVPRATDTPTGPVSTNPVPQPTPLVQRGSLVANGQNIVPLLGGSLARFENFQVTGTSVRVFAVVDPETFWVGPSKERRLLLHLRLKGRKAPKVRRGQRVSFYAAMRPNAGQAYGVTEPAGISLLARQGFHAEASVLDLKLR